MYKPLIDRDTESYTPEGSEFMKRAAAAINPLVVEYADNDYSAIDIERILIDAVFISCIQQRSQRSIERRLKECQKKS